MALMQRLSQLLVFGAVGYVFISACPNLPLQLIEPTSSEFTHTGFPTFEFPDLLEAGIEELSLGLVQGRWTSVDLVKAYTLRINEVQDQLRAVPEINEQALSAASQLDAERARGHVRGKLHGIPILVKDNIAAGGDVENNAGSVCLQGSRTKYPSTAFAKLQDAGAILLGKASLSEWAFARSTNSSSGWSAVSGQTLGAYMPHMNPCGSSSGSAVAMSVGLAAASLGTETHGSIICPSGFNNIVGIKPTVGLVSRFGVIPISEHQDTPGPMTRTVTDAAYILSAIAGKDTHDNYTNAQPWDSPPDYLRALNASSLQGARIGIPRNAYNLDDIPPEVMQGFEAGIQALKDAGATVVDPANYSLFNLNPQLREYADANESIVMRTDMVHGIKQYLTHLQVNPHGIQDLADVRRCTQELPVEEYPARNTGVWDKALATDFDNTDYRAWEAYQHTSHFGGPGGVTGALEKYKLDALALPSVSSYHASALAGLPIITVPLGFQAPDAERKGGDWGIYESGPNFPFGISFLGGKWSEETLISLAYAFEQRTQVRTRVQPLYMPHTQLSDVLHR